ncbi:MAG: NUDIX domain-containing protein [Chlamydiota bacterium]|nr:NUDIX domain-containing protein [Chlamydiota bacterium]
MVHQSNKTTLVYQTKPVGFNSAVEASACYIEYAGKTLFLLRACHKPEGGKWGVPGGKVEQSETSLEAAIRETFEETGIVIADSQINFVSTLYIRKPNIDYSFHMFQITLNQLPKVTLNPEHEDYRWLTPQDLLNYPIMSGGLEALNHYIALTNKPKIPRTPFFFIRHGETDANTDPDIKDVDADLPLNSKGIDQAFMAKKIAENLPLKTVCSSPIQRAKQTKDIIVSSMQLDDFEIEGLSECKAYIWKKMVHIEKGSNFHVCNEVNQFLNKALAGIASALEKESPTLIVAHGGIHWALCYYLSIENHLWKIGNCKLVHFMPVDTEGWKAEVIDL